VVVEGEVARGFFTGAGRMRIGEEDAVALGMAGALGVEVELVVVLGTTGFGCTCTGVGEEGVEVARGEGADAVPDEDVTNPPPPLVMDEDSGEPKSVKSEKWVVVQVTVSATGSRVQLERTFQTPWS
jgi:hypothetical protein